MSDSESSHSVVPDEVEMKQMLAAYNAAEAISHEYQNVLVCPPEPLEFEEDDEKEEKEEQVEEEASETESVGSLHTEQDTDDDEEENDEEEGREEDSRGDDRTWPTRLDQVIFRFQDAFTVAACLMNKRDRKVYSVIRNTDDRPMVIVVSQDNVSRLNIHGVPREVRLMKRLQGVPGVAQLRAWLPLSRRRYCLLMDHYPSCELVTAAAGNRYLIAKMTKSILTALKAIHAAGVVHRDIARANVLWDPIKEEATIIDFDVSAPMRSKYYRAVGRDNYDAPEKADTLALREKLYHNQQRKLSSKHKMWSYDFRADIYSVGVLLFMMLKRAEHSPEPKELRKWMKTVMRRNGHRRDPAIDLAVRMLQRDPRNRITVDAALGHRFLTETEVDDEYRNIRRYLLKMNDLPVPPELETESAAEFDEVLEEFDRSDSSSSGFSSSGEEDEEEEGDEEEEEKEESVPSPVPPPAAEEKQEAPDQGEKKSEA